jgi:hypothetical protein
MTEGHEEYQKAIREVLAPTLDYKKKWVMLKERIDNFNAKIQCESYGPCTGEFRAGFDRALGWVDSVIEKLEMN